MRTSVTKLFTVERQNRAAKEATVEKKAKLLNSGFDELTLKRAIGKLVISQGSLTKD